MLRPPWWRWRMAMSLLRQGFGGEGGSVVDFTCGADLAGDHPESLKPQTVHHRRPSSGLLGPDGPDGRPPADARNNNKRQNQRTIPPPPPPPPPAATTLDEDSLHIPIQTNRIHLLLLSTHSLSSELESPFDVNTNIHGKCPLPTTTAKRPEWMESGCGDHGLGISTPKSWPCLI